MKRNSMLWNVLGCKIPYVKLFEELQKKPSKSCRIRVETNNKNSNKTTDRKQFYVAKF